MLLGPTDGNALGSPDGSKLGSSDGRFVGAVVIGDVEGFPEVSVGFADGSALGLLVAVTGVLVGAAELGSKDGDSEACIEVGVSVDSVGPLKGRPVGSKDGSLDVISLGTDEGCEVGSPVIGVPFGCPRVRLGLAEGDSVGSTLGVLLGLSDGLSVGSSVASSLGLTLDVVDPPTRTSSSVRVATYPVELRNGSKDSNDPLSSVPGQIDEHEVSLT